MNEQEFCKSIEAVSLVLAEDGRQDRIFFEIAKTAKFYAENDSEPYMYILSMIYLDLLIKIGSDVFLRMIRDGKIREFVDREYRKCSEASDDK